MDETIRREDLPSMDFSRDATGESRPPVTPGEVLREDFLLPLRPCSGCRSWDTGEPRDGDHRRPPRDYRGNRADAG